MIFFAGVVEKDGELDFTELNRVTREWEARAARGECSWICSDCCCSFAEGMPDECPHGQQRCTDIIQRNKAEAHDERNLG